MHFVRGWHVLCRKENTISCQPFKYRPDEQQWMIFSLHKHWWYFLNISGSQQYWNLSMYSDSFVLTTTLIYKYRQDAMSIHTTVTSNSYTTQLVITTLQSGLLTYILIPLTLCMLMLYISAAIYSLKSTPNDRFFEKLFMGIWICSRGFCQKYAERKSLKKYSLDFILMPGLWLESWLYV